MTENFLCGHTDTGLAFLGEGADMLVLKPEMTSVDILTILKRRTQAPLMPFSVSGEYMRVAPLNPATGRRDFRPLAELFTMLKRARADTSRLHHRTPSAGSQVARTPRLDQHPHPGRRKNPRHHPPPASEVTRMRVR